MVAQTLRDWELIVVDDGSTDETGEYLSGLTDRRIRVIAVDHTGIPGKARNIGARVARGRYIAFLDSDDVWAASKLEAQLAALERKPDTRWSYTYYQSIDVRGDVRPETSKIRFRACEGWIFEQLVTLEAYVALPSVVADRALFEEVGGFDETLQFFEDYDLWLRLARRSPVTVVTRPLIGVRDHAGNTWRSYGAKTLEFWARVYDRLLADPELREFRRVCRRMRIRAGIVVADRYRSERRYGTSIRTLMSALPLGSLRAAWWACLAKTVLRPVTPPPALRLYYALLAMRR